MWLLNAAATIAINLGSLHHRLRANPGGFGSTLNTICWRTSLQMERACVCCREQLCSWPDGLPRMAGLQVAGIRCAMHAPGSDASCRCAASTPPTPLLRRQSFRAPCNRRRSCMRSNASLGSLGPACAVHRTAGLILQHKQVDPLQILTNIAFTSTYERLLYIARAWLYKHATTTLA